jgi:hypothetical protein
MPRAGPVCGRQRGRGPDPNLWTRSTHARTHALNTHHSAVCEAQHRGYIRETSGPLQSTAAPAVDLLAAHHTAPHTAVSHNAAASETGDWLSLHRSACRRVPDSFCVAPVLTLRPDSQIALPILGAFLILRLVSRGGPLIASFGFVAS